MLAAFLIGAAVFVGYRLEVRRHGTRVLLPAAGLVLCFSGLVLAMRLGTSATDGDVMLSHGEVMLYYFLRRPHRSWPGYLMIEVGAGLLLMSEDDLPPPAPVQANDGQAGLRRIAPVDDAPENDFGEDELKPEPKPRPEVELPDELLAELAAVADPDLSKQTGKGLAATQIGDHELILPLDFPADYRLRVMLSRSQPRTVREKLKLYFPVDGIPCALWVPQRAGAAFPRAWIGAADRSNPYGRVFSPSGWPASGEMPIEIDVRGRQVTLRLGSTPDYHYTAVQPLGTSLEGADRLRLILSGRGWTISEASLEHLPPNDAGKSP